MSKTLITGGAGFFGVHLAKCLLKSGYKIDLVDNLSRGVNDEELKSLSDKPDVRLLNRDLFQADVLNDLDDNYKFIYHLAAIVGVANVMGRPYTVLRDNISMLVNMLSFASRQSSLQRFVFASTSEVYAGTLQHFSLPIPTSESTPLALTDLDHPRTSYMLSKIYGEAMCHHSRVPFTIVRPHNIYGPRMGMAHVIPELLKKAHYASDGAGLDVFSVNHRRTFCYICDAVIMMKLAAESSVCKGETLNIGNQSPEISIGELARLILNIVGKNLEISEKPATPGSPLRRCPDMTKTIKLIGYKSQVEIYKGLRLTYDWYRTNVFGGKAVCAK